MNQRFKNGASEKSDTSLMNECVRILAGSLKGACHVSLKNCFTLRSGENS
jgi:hypothetical protein